MMAYKGCEGLSTLPNHGIHEHRVCGRGIPRVTNLQEMEVSLATDFLWVCEK